MKKGLYRDDLLGKSQSIEILHNPNGDQIRPRSATLIVMTFLAGNSIEVVQLANPTTYREEGPLS